jgi:hypothetical protein
MSGLAIRASSNNTIGSVYNASNPVLRHEIVPNLVRSLPGAATTFVKSANTYCTSVKLINRVEHCERSWFILLHFSQNVIDSPHTRARQRLAKAA